MKKIAAAIMVALFAASGMFAMEINLETGLTFGGAAREIESQGYIAKDKETVSTSLAGIYFAGDFELNEYFGLFADVSFNSAFNTSSEYTTGLTGSFNWADPNYEVSSFGSLLLGTEYILHLGDSFKLKLGGGLDFAIAESKANGVYIDPANLIAAQTINLLYSDWTRKSAFIGLGTKAKVNFDLNERFGFNAGIVADWYFLALSETKTKGIYSSSISSGVLLENTFAIRPEFGVTFRLGAED